MSPLSKVFEKIILKRLLSFLDKNKILYDYQFGFRHHYSTELAIFELIDYISKLLDEGKDAVGIFLDLSKAFDTVNTDILLQKLSVYGIRGVALSLFESYLKNRIHYVQIDNILSAPSDIICGIPQGSILGPILFLLYINDMPNCSSLLNFRMFADDTNALIYDKNLDELKCKTNTELMLVADWLATNKLSLNIMKTKFVLFHGKNKSITNFQISLNGHNIERVENIKYLGVFINQHLNWDKHIAYVNSKLGRAVGIICKLRSFLNLDILKQLYYSISYPHMTYGVIAWGNSSASSLKRIYSKQRKIVRLITYSNYNEPTEHLFKTLTLLNFDNIYVLQCTKLMYKYYHQLLPQTFNNYFNSIDHRYNIRDISFNFRTNSFKNKYGRYSPSNICISLWNNIPNEFKQLPFNLFKKSLISMFLDK